MDFPAYVPNAVRERVLAILEGDGRGLTGWLAALAKAEAEVHRLEQQPREPRHHEADELRIECAEAIAHRAHLAEDIACVRRLVYHVGMQSAYSWLARVPCTDAFLSGFIYAASAARMEYGKYRQWLKEAADLAHKVAKTAGVLAELLTRAEQYRYFPSEFLSVASLLEKSEPDRSDRSFSTWPAARDLLLGEQPLKPVGTFESGATQKPGHVVVVRVERGSDDLSDAARSELRNAWKTAPSVTRMIATLELEALAFVPNESGVVGAAVASRKQSPKAAYLRAFVTVLRDQHGMKPTNELMHAIAATATAVLNDPDIDVSFGDVRRALTTAT